MGRITVVSAAVLALFFVAVVPLHAQSTVDVVYLKNGSVIRGTIVEQVPNESIKIETADGSVFVFKMSDVEKIVKEKSANAKEAPPATPVKPMAPIYLVVNPLGFLQMGPMVDAEFRVTPRLYALAHVRIQGLGLLSHVLASDNIAFWSTAVGSGVRYFFTSTDTPHAPYLGFAFEVGYNPYSGDIGTSYEYSGRSIYLTLAANAGYRWRFEKFIMNVGGYVGAAPTLSSKWSYVNAPSVIYDGTLDTTFVAMVELSFGWAL